MLSLTHFENFIFITFLAPDRTSHVLCYNSKPIMNLPCFPSVFVECLLLHSFLSGALAASVVLVTSPDMAPGNHMVVETSSQRPLHVS